MQARVAEKVETLPLGDIRFHLELHLELTHTVEMFGHIGVEDHGDARLAEGLILTRFEALKCVDAVVRSGEREEHRGMVILKHTLVVVAYGEGRRGVDVERVVDTVVPDIVASGGNEHGTTLERREMLPETRRSQEPVDGLNHVGSVGVIVVWIPGDIAVLDGLEEGSHLTTIDLELLEAAVRLQGIPSDVEQRAVVGALGHTKHVKVPRVEFRKLVHEFGLELFWKGKRK
mmetsp:Transcript_51552/g.120955  ORF Transcript_51552/g.120955 Transcript_51552/m.120955 type:complete len:231 (+) Transcript_51552:399-1091(+)